MSLDSLLRQYRKKTIDPNRPPATATIDRAEKVFDLSTQRNIPIEEADAEILAGELMEYTKGLEDSPLFQNIDGLIDVFDPSEPPMEGAGQPINSMLEAEIAAVKPPVKWAIKAMSYIFAPLDRGLKFATNALMHDPLFKSAVGPVKKAVVWQTRIQAIHDVVIERMPKRIEAIKKELHNEKLTGVRYYSELSTRTVEERKKLTKEVADEIDKDFASYIQKAQQELPEVKVGWRDFAMSGLNALKALVPWPGVADDVKSFGEISSDSFERIVGREAPGYYTLIGDILFQTAALMGLLKMANSATTAKNARTFAQGAKLTKAELRAIKKLHKMASQPQKIPTKAIGVPSTNESLTASQKLIALIKEAKPLRNKKKLLIHQDRVKKAAKLAQVQKNIRGKGLVSATKGALKGKAPIPDFTPINVKLSSAEIDTLFDMVNTFNFGGQSYAKGNAILSLDKLLKGKLITKSEISYLEQVFGKGLTKALVRKQSLGSIAQDITLDVINTPRALLASFDLSAGGRQGIIFSVSHPISSVKAMGRSVRAALNKQYCDDIERVTRANWKGRISDKFLIHSSPTGFAAKLTAKEEMFMSRIAENLPFGIGKLVAASERAFTTFLNQQRREVFGNQALKWINRGITPEKNAKSFFQYAKFVNHATGRGSLDQLAPETLTAMNATFFAPRFQFSRVQVMGDLINPKTTWTARKVIARDLAEFYTTGMGVMGMAKAGGAEVEMDWRSSDFGKIKVGNTRYNYWGGFQPLVRLAGQMYSGEKKQLETGKIKKADRTEIIATFLRTKLAPVPGRVVDIFVGETFLGEPVEPTKKFIGKATYESLVPLFVQDSVDAWRFQGADGQFPLSATLAFTGIGVQTWELAPFAQLEIKKDSLARQTFGKNYDELSFVEVKMLDADILVNWPGIVKLEQQIKFESNSVNFLKKQAKDLRKSERFLEKHIDKQLLGDMADMQLRTGGVDRAFGNWRLDDEQYEEYQKLVAKNINELFEEMRPLWDTKDNDDPAKFELMSKILNGAKLLAAQEMKIGDIE